MKDKNDYIQFPHVLLINEGISYERQKELNVHYDIKNNVIIIPVLSQLK